MSQEQRQSDGLGRVDLLVKEGVRRYVVESQDPAYLALYGKFGDAFNGLVDQILGPVKVGGK